MCRHPRSVRPQSNQAELERARLAAKVDTLNQTIASLRSDLATMKQETNERVTVIERSKPAEPNADIAQKVRTALASAAKTPGEVSSVAPGAPAPEAGEPSSSGVSKPEPRASGVPSYASNFATIPPKAPAVTVDATAETAKLPPPVSAAVKSPTEKALEAPSTRPRGPNLAIVLPRPGSAPPLPGFVPRATPARGTTQPTSPVRTGSVPSDARTGARLPESSSAPSRFIGPISFGAPQIVAAPRGISANVAAGGTALALSTAPSITGLRASWLLLTTRHGELLGNFRPRYTTDPENGGYRLLAGPVLNRAEADRICSKLRSKNVICGVSEYTGERL